MTREESIELAEKLEKDYAQLENIQKELEENNQAIHRPYSSTKTEWGDFYHGYLLLGVLLCIFVLPLVNFYAAAFIDWLIHSGKIDPMRGISNAIRGMFFLTIADFFLIQLIGYLRSKRKSDQYNRNVDVEIKDREKRVHTLMKRNVDLNKEMVVLLNRVYNSEKSVPVQFRTSSHMHQVKKLISSGKAEDFSGAILLLEQ